MFLEHLFVSWAVFVKITEALTPDAFSVLIWLFHKKKIRWMGDTRIRSCRFYECSMYHKKAKYPKQSAKITFLTLKREIYINEMMTMRK